MEHHLPDEVGRANTNLAAEGSRIFPMPYEEMDRHLVEGMDFSGRTIPDGIFDRWIRTARSEFLMVSARWDEADKVLSGLDASSSEAYLNSEILSMRGLLYAYRGRLDEAAAMTADVADAALRIGDLQAVIPALTAQFAIRIGTEEDTGAVEACGRPSNGAAISRRPSQRLVRLRSGRWADHDLRPRPGLGGAAGRPGAPRFLLCPYRARCRPHRRPRPASRLRMPCSAPRSSSWPASRVAPACPSRCRRAISWRVLTPSPVLDREHRPFDAARIRLWLAEEAGGGRRTSTQPRDVRRARRASVPRARIG